MPLTEQGRGPSHRESIAPGSSRENRSSLGASRRTSARAGPVCDGDAVSAGAMRAWLSDRDDGRRLLDGTADDRLR